MTVFDAKHLENIIQRVKAQPELANKAAALAINKTVTLSLKEAVKDITSETTLQPSYVRRHIKRVSRAAPNNLRSVVHANTRETLLTRFQYYEARNGVHVRVNKRGGFEHIPHARVMKQPLRGSSRAGIVLANKHAAKHFQSAINQGAGRTAGKSRKLQKIIARARVKPYGVTVLHSRSINQLFVSARDRMKPSLQNKIVSEFKADFRRLSK